MRNFQPQKGQTNIKKLYIKKFLILAILSLKFGTRLNTVYSKTLICKKQNKHSN